MSTKPLTKTGSFNAAYFSSSGALKKRKRIGKTDNLYRISVSAASIILVFPPRVIVITLFYKKLSIYYIIFNGILLNLRLSSNASYVTLSKAPATSSNIRLAIAFLLIPYIV